MATPHSLEFASRTVIRRQTVTELLVDHAQAILDERGAGAVTVSEIARRMGMRSPSVYKYFDSLNAIYDALFARGQARLEAYVYDAVADCTPGLQTLLEGNRALVRWTTHELGLASLLFWRPVPGFEPRPETYAAAEEFSNVAREHLRLAVGRGELSPAADSDEAQRLLTVLVSGVVSQQMANQPGASFDDGLFTSLTDDVLSMFAQQYARSHPKERP
jgi:AcrR family transcriptional regulator